MLGIIVLPLLPARKHVPSSLLCTKKGFTRNNISASKIAPKSTIYRIIKNFKESGSNVVKSDQINSKVPLCQAYELNPQKTFTLHFRPATKGPADIMSVILSLTRV